MIAAGLDEETSRAGFAISTLSSRDLVNSFLPILRGFGKELIDPESSVPQLDTPEAIAAMQIFEQLILLSPNESPATGELTNAERFSLGDIAMMSNYWATDWLSASAGVEPITDDLLATLQPAESEIERTCLPNIWVAGIPQGSLMSAEAQAFVDWLVLASTQEGFAAVGLPPARTDLVLAGELRGLEIPLASVAQLLAQSRIAPRSPYYPQLSRLLGDALARLLAGDLSGSEALREANVAMREFLSREGVLLS
ncbi:MAG: hypothetical protein M9947_06045 [Thermomicrobiales bacterium]|nr:hypothetical protein [Thermomicrobiales bacterium]